MGMKTINEGLVKIKAPDVDLPEDGEIFYNPQMEFDRDISVALLKTLGVKSVLDGMAATGVRGIRYNKEAKCRVMINDANPQAVSLIRKNAKTNKSRVRIRNDNINVIPFEENFDFIDVDPFGTPAPFLDSVVRGFGKSGFAAFTATDTACLCGVYPDVSFRRYGVTSFRSYYCKEFGLRILISAMIKSFARHDFAFTPILSYSRRHYFRVIGKVEKGTSKANRALKNFDIIGKSKEPVYTGPLNGNLKPVIDVLKESGFKKSKSEIKFLEGLDAEVDIPLFYNIEDICKDMKVSIPKMEYIVESLKRQDYQASRTHFLATGLKSTAPLPEIKKAIRTSRKDNYRA